MKVLIADPDWRFAHFATTYLEAHAHLVITTPQAQDAIQRTNHWQPDVVILAAELAEKGLLASLQTMPTRPAILLTEHMERFDRAWRIWQTGGDELLLKPIFHGDELHLSIAAAMENAAVGTRAAAGIAVSA